MKRLTFSLLSVCALSLSGCCWPGMMWPFYGGCGPGGCAPGGYGGYPPMQQTSWEASYAPVQGVPTTTIAPIAAQPIVTTPMAYQQAAPMAYQQAAPTMALESLPTFR